MDNSTQRNTLLEICLLGEINQIVNGTTAEGFPGIKLSSFYDIQKDDLEQTLSELFESLKNDDINIPGDDFDEITIQRIEAASTRSKELYYKITSKQKDYISFFNKDMTKWYQIHRLKDSILPKRYVLFISPVNL